MNRPQGKPVLALDFDGVIHSYEKGWQDGAIYGGVTEGFFDWAAKAKQHFRLMIYSSRSGSHKERQPMEDWLHVQLQGWKWDCEAKGDVIPDLSFFDFEFPDRKPPAFLTIDDRAVCFHGSWDACDPALLLNFHPWNYSESNK
jgi:hypothetical protein